VQISTKNQTAQTVTFILVSFNMTGVHI